MLFEITSSLFTLFTLEDALNILGRHSEDWAKITKIVISCRSEIDTIYKFVCPPNLELLVIDIHVSDKTCGKLEIYLNGSKPKVFVENIDHVEYE